MKIWLDAHLSPSTAAWMTASLGIDARPIRDVGLRDAADLEIFLAARSEGAVILTKDSDFVEVLMRLGPPPQVILLRVGNTSNANLARILASVWSTVSERIRAGESLIEIVES